MNQFWLSQKTIANLFLEMEGYDREVLLKFLLEKMEQRDREEVLDVLEGRRLPSLSADIIAKKVFAPDEHPERLQKMLRDLTGDDGIVVGDSFRKDTYSRSQVRRLSLTYLPGCWTDESLIWRYRLRRRSLFLRGRTFIRQSC